MRRKIGCLLIGWMILMFAACGGKENSSATNSKEHIYRSETVAIEGIEDASIINDLQIKYGRMYITTLQWEEEGSVLQLISQNMDGTDRKNAELKLAENEYYSRMTGDAEGNYYGVFNEYFEDDSDPQNLTWRNDYYLVKLDGTGSELWRQPLIGENPDEYWVDWIALLTDGRIVLCDADGIFLYDAQGNKTGKAKLQKELQNISVFQMQDGTLLLQSYHSEKNTNILNKWDVDTGELSEDYMIPGGLGNYGMMNSGEGYDLFLVGNGSIYGYNLGDTQLKELMNFIDSDLSSYYIYNFAAVNENEFYGVTDDALGQSVFMKFTKVDSKDVKDKRILTLGCNGLDWEVRRQVVEFNKNNEEYRITVEDYSNYNTDEDYTVGLTRLNTDIASGKAPDILLLDSSMPIDSYASKGLFEDFYPYMDEDEELNREDFFSNVLEAYGTNGKLYRMVPKFIIYTVAGKTADVGANPGWTMDKLMTVMDTKPEGTQIFSEMTRESIMNYGIQMSGDQYINWKTGECHFNTEEFIDFLEFVKQFPEELGEDYYNDAFWQSYDSMWRENKVLLKQMYLSSFSSYNYDKKGTFGEDITLIGFPVKEGNGAALMAGIEMAMSSKSKNKDGAWQFIRYFLTDGYQGQIDYYWPLSLKQMDKLAEEAMKNPTYEDENGNMVEMEQTYMLSGMEVAITPMSRTEVDQLIAYIKTVNQVYSYNEALLNIVSEEAAPYFAGQKNAKEVADIIQSRVQIYVNENR